MYEQLKVVVLLKVSLNDTGCLIISTYIQKEKVQQKIDFNLRRLTIAEK